MQGALAKAFEELNPEQQQAVTTLDGPVLVVAGPGTGKTQLLSLRVANILESRDVSPHNILCLTFTNAGADAMRERLAGFIGRSAYEVSIETFHSFALYLCSAYPEYFTRSVFDRAITSLESAKLINQLLKELPVTDPLYQNPFDGVSGNLRSVSALIGKIKKSGLMPEDIIAICQQNSAFFDYFEKEKTEVLESLGVSLQKGTREEKKQRLDDLKTELLLALEAVPAELTTQLVTLTGSYEPYASLLKRVVLETDFYDDNGNTSGFREDVRDRFFKGTPLRFKERWVNAATYSVVALYQRYQDHLNSNALFDFDDMILDVNEALERNPAFAHELREHYQYILIDEFQDTNGAQMKIIESIVSGLERPNILAVGDDDQAIMRFQGASVEFINQFEHKYDHTQSIVLQKNYRSVPQIVALGQELAGQIEERLATSKDSKHLKAAREEMGSPDFSPRVYTASELQYYEIAKEIKAMIDNGFMEQSEHPDSEIAVIARKHDSLRALIPYLEHHEVAFNYRVRREVSQIASLQTLFSVMRFAVSWTEGSLRWAEAELPRIIAAPELDIDPKHYLMLACEARRVGGWLSALQTSTEPTLKALFDKLCAASVKAVTAPVREAILDLSKDMLAYYDTRKDTDPSAALEFNYGLKALLTFAQEEIEVRSPRRKRMDGLQGSLRLASVVELLDQSELFSVEVAATIPLASKHAITLTTAHNSKGLEYDCVYLIDADRNNWRKSGGGAQLITQNIYLSESEDTDDFRRLLFVAATRARNELRISLAGPNLVPELVDLVEQRKVDVMLEDIERIAPLSWQDAYVPQKESLASLAAELLSQRRLSVSLLNAFVDYKGNTLDGTEFLTNRLLSLPQKPLLAADFGTVVHEYLSGYLNEVVKQGSMTEEELAQNAHDALAALDHPAEDLVHLAQRFDLIREHFMPEFTPRLTMDAHAEQSFDIMLDEVPLTGRIDLLVKNSDTHTIAIYDYKTGAVKSPEKQGANYKRQLQFYKLLVESSPHYKGWRVTGGADIFIEPDRKNTLTLAPEEFVFVGEDELEHLRVLIKAVWHRLHNNLFDTTDFLHSEQLAALRARTVYKSASGDHKKGDLKEPAAQDYQRTYEEWLIDEYLAQNVVTR